MPTTTVFVILFVEVEITDTVLVPDSVTHTSLPSGVAAAPYGLVVPLEIAEASANVDVLKIPTAPPTMAGTNAYVVPAMSGLFATAWILARYTWSPLSPKSARWVVRFSSSRLKVRGSALREGERSQ